MSGAVRGVTGALTFFCHHMSVTESHNPVVPLLLALLFSGCAGEHERIVLEKKLRSQESRIRDLEQEARRTEQLLADQDKELAAARSPHTANRTPDGNIKTISATTESAAAWGSVTAVAIHRLTSGLVSDSERTEINVVIQPLDDDGELVKVAGQLKVTAAVVNSDGAPTVVAVREITMTESRKLWTRTLVSSGFHVQLTASDAIQPDTNVVLSAVLSLGQGRTFSTSEVIQTQ